jgi:hypothetical protein
MSLKTIVAVEQAPLSPFVLLVAASDGAISKMPQPLYCSPPQEAL